MLWILSYETTPHDRVQKLPSIRAITAGDVPKHQQRHHDIGGVHGTSYRADPRFNGPGESVEQDCVRVGKAATKERQQSSKSNGHTWQRS